MPKQSSKANQEWRKIELERQKFDKKIKKKISNLFSEEENKLIESIKLNGIDSVFDVLNKNNETWETAYKQLYKEVIPAFVKLQLLSPIDNAQFDNFLDIATNTFISQNVGRKITFVSNTTKYKVSKIVEKAKAEALTIAETQDIIYNFDDFKLLEEQLVIEGVKDTYQSFSASRALMIARTEVGSASSYGQFEGGRLSGASKKIWNTAKDPEVRPSHQSLSGQEVDLNSKFSNGLMYPLDPFGSGKEIINCRCSLSFR
ncbi:MAG TPA: hypothetical protein DCM02_04710 [Flavobacterium sp.]|nr:hypothetical protein [Flavobacterium sp.]